MLCIIGLVLVVLIAFYIPPVQDAIFKKVSSVLNEGDSGLHIEYKSLRIKFPTHLVGEDLKVSLPGDINAGIGYIDANLNLMPLLKLDISTEEIEILKADFKLGAPDSSLYLNAGIDTLIVKDISVDLKNSLINLSDGDIAGVDVSLDIGQSKEKEDTTTSEAGKSFVIDAKRLSMERLNYRMSIYPTIDTIATQVHAITLLHGIVDLNKHTIEAADFDVDIASAKYIYSASTKDDATEKVADNIEEEPDSLPWTVRVGKIDLTAGKALYAEKGAKPVEGFDARYINVTDIKIDIDSFYNCRQDITVPIKHLGANYDSRMLLLASGLFEIKNSEMHVENFDLSLPGSKLSATAMMGLKSERYPRESECPVSAELRANVAPGDIAFFFPDLSPIIQSLPPATPLVMALDAQGTMDNIGIDDMILELPRYLRLSASGYAAGFNPMNLNYLSADLRAEGNLLNADIVKPSVVEAKLGKGIKLIPLNVTAETRILNGNAMADVSVKTQGGSISLDGKVNLKSEGYDIDLSTRHFPIQAIMPRLGISNVSISANANGNSFNPMAKGATMNADITVDSVFFNHKKLYSVRLMADIDKGNADINLSSGMKNADFKIAANGNLSGKKYDWKLNGDIANIQLMEMGFSQVPNGGSMKFNALAIVDADSMYVAAKLNVPQLTWNLNGRSVSSDDLALAFNADKKSTEVQLTDHDLAFDILSPLPLDSVLKDVSKIGVAVDSCIKLQNIDVNLLQHSLPPFNARLSAKKNNIISKWLATRGEYFDSLGVNISNDSLIAFKALIKDYNTPKYIVDTLSAEIYQRNDSLDFRFHLLNSPMSPGDWANVNLWGRLGGNQLDVRFRQQNHKGETGIFAGLQAQIADSTVTLHFTPTQPTIAYKTWNINDNNFLSVDFADKHLDADLTVTQGNSALRFYTDHIPGSTDQEEINLQLQDIQISDWIALNPFATPMKGLLSGKISLSHEGKVFTGDGNVSLKDYYYGKRRVGNFDLGLDVSTTPGGFVHASADVDIDSVKVLKLYGFLNDTTKAEPFMLNLDIDSLPLKVANPFLADAGIALKGELNGTMKVTGTPSSPVFNGYIDFDSTGVTVNMLGTTYQLSEKKIPVDTGVVRFNKYDIHAVNDNPLIIDGFVNMRDVFNPSVDLKLTAEDTQLVGTDRARGGADVYGKAFVNLDATVKGDMSWMNVNAKADILNTTNVTYVMVGGAQSALQSRSNSNLVKFVNFADTSMVAAADSIKLKGMLLNVNALLSIQRGATLSVDLSADGKNKVQLQPVGDLDYSMDPLGGQHLTGRITIDDGFARYTPPLMSEKLFNIEDGSYVDFNGNISNPILNIHAVDRLRANVTQEGQNSRLIYFNIGLNVTGTLENMNINFDLSTDDDLTVENELESMSPSQRASKAMNLLITNTYTGPGTSADANLGANALYSFLGSTLNSWAANNIKAVDLSFGVNQYENTTNGVSSQATRYSYNVSKSLFNDRFKINVGGNYTTDADADENLAENLISDVSLEYMLNKNGSMYLKVFRHAGFESLLEGEVIQTGVGVTYRKRMDSLKNMFWFFYGRKKKHAADNSPSDSTTVKTDSINVRVDSATVKADSTVTKVTASGHESEIRQGVE